jgi:hypothetical protein
MCAGVTGLRRVCPRCQTTFFLCRRCDRWHCYCSSSCSEQARKDSRQRSDRKYRQSASWRAKNPEHQAEHRRKRFRQKIVSEQCSASATSPVDIAPSTTMASDVTQKEHHANEPIINNQPLVRLRPRQHPVGRCLVCGCAVAFLVSPKGFPPRSERIRFARRP